MKRSSNELETKRCPPIKQQRLVILAGRPRHRSPSPERAQQEMVYYGINEQNEPHEYVLKETASPREFCFFCPKAPLDSATPCFYCDEMICIKCTYLCYKCKYNFCKNCTLPVFGTDNLICYECEP